MGKGIRLSESFFHHRKTRMLRKRLGAAGLMSLVRLWCFAAQSVLDGDLSTMSLDDIAVASGWEGDPTLFVTVLREVKFLDNFKLHEWDIHTTYANNWYSPDSINNYQERKKCKYRLWRMNVLDRDNHTCQFCGKENSRIAHHVKSFSEFKDDRFNIENGKTVCVPCHKNIHYGNT